MKRLFSYILGAVAVLAVAACNKENKPAGVIDDGGAPISVDEQKQHIETTASTIMDALALEKWQDDYDFAMASFTEISSLFGSSDVQPEPMSKADVNIDQLKQWVEELQQLWGTYVDKDPEGKIDDYRSLVLAIKLSQATGHFYLNDNDVIVKEEGTFDDFVLSATVAEEPVSIRVKAVDSESLINVSKHFEQGQNYYYYEEYQVYVPSSLTVSILRSNKEFASLNLGASFTDVNNNHELDLDVDSVALNAEFNVSILSVKLPEASYAPGSINVKSSIHASGQLIIAEEISVGTVVNNGVEPKSGELYVDLAGLTQVRLLIPDVDKFSEAQAAASSSEPMTQDKAKSVADALNASFSSGVYYDHANTVQASLTFIVAPLEVEGSATVYEIVPAIKFSDGTTVTAIEFVSNNLSSLYQDIMTWLGGIVAYVTE